MAESKKDSKSSGNSNGSSGGRGIGGKHVLLEYNCPIIHIAEKHWEACSTETELFEKNFGADIETTHRAAKGDLICKDEYIAIIYIILNVLVCKLLIV
jgi:hypothetical protein